ncbi:MAG TPA: glycoside hydrolase, partial [Cellvibrio sp.]|nr:glycoside hydrolase [Cellvibrio sp.]
NKHYFIYHTGAGRPDGGQYRRSVSIDELFYNPDGTIKRIIMTSEGVSPNKAANKAASKAK